MPRKSPFLFCRIFFSLIVAATLMVPKHAQAQTYTGTVLSTVSGSPNSTLIQAADGNFYGTTLKGGANSDGSVFKITPTGTLTTLYSFCSAANCTDGQSPAPGLIQGGDGNLYGVTTYGGTGVYCHGGPDGNLLTCGTIFKITPAGVLTTLYNFCTDFDTDSDICPEGQYPAAGLVQGTDGNFYGTAEYEGPEYGDDGTLFKITLAGLLTPLTQFYGANQNPNGQLVQGSDGNFYGTTLAQGAGGEDEDVNGSIFKVTPSGTLTTLYSFTGANDGGSPNSGLLEASDGNLYGTAGGGEDDDGAVFKITSAGADSTLYSFTGADGVEPRSGVTLGSDGNFYGTTDYGPVYQVTPAGVASTIYSYSGVSGGIPEPGIAQGSDGNFYGNSSWTGDIFKITVAPALPAQVQLSFSSSSTNAGEAVTLTWKVLNGFSLTMQQCYAFVANSATGAGTWTGLQTGSLVDNVYTGTASITPTAAGDYTYALTCGGVESGFASLNVNATKAATTTTLTTNSPVALNGSVTLTATVGTSPYSFGVTGTVAFKYGSTALGSVTPVNGVATLDVSANGIPAGTYPISATYSGNTNYDASSGTANLVIVGYATSATLTTSANKITQGQSVTLTSKVTRTSVSGTPTGTVNFYSGTLELGSATLVSGTATFTAATSGSIPAGTYPITAKYSGDASDQTATSPTVSITLLAATATTLTASPNPVPADSSVTITITVKEKYGTAFPTGTVTLSVGSNTLGSPALADGVATVNASDFNYPAGTYAVTATYSGDAHNAASSGTLNITVE